MLGRMLVEQCRQDIAHCFVSHWLFFFFCLKSASFLFFFPTCLAIDFQAGGLSLVHVSEGSEQCVILCSVLGANRTKRYPYPKSQAVSTADPVNHMKQGWWLWGEWCWQKGGKLPSQPLVPWLLRSPWSLVLDWLSK